MPAGDALELAHPQCQAWANGTEGGFYHLENALLSLGYIGGSGPFGALYIFSFLLLAFLCQALGGWASGCGTGALAWGVLQVVLCVLQLVHVLLRLWWEVLPGAELKVLYSALFQPLGAPPRAAYRQVVDACGNCVLSLDEEEAYALEGTTAIDRLSFLLSGSLNIQVLDKREGRGSELDQGGPQDPNPTHQPDLMRSLLPDDPSNHDGGSSQPPGEDRSSLGPNNFGDTAPSLVVYGTVRQYLK